MAITPLPTPPSRDDPTNFSARGDAFLGALPAFATEANALAVDVNADAVAAAAAEVAATAAAAGAQAASNVTKWVSGTTYAEGVVVWSPITYLSYRRKTAGAGTTDPSADSTNWAQAAGTGDVTLTGTQTLTNKTINIANNTLTGVQPTLVSGTNIKTINDGSVLGSGNLVLSSGLNLVQTVNASGSTAVINGFSSTYDNYKLLIRDVFPSADGRNFELKFFIGGTLVTGNYNYAYVNVSTSGASSDIGSAGDNTIRLANSMDQTTFSRSNQYEINIFGVNGGSTFKSIIYNGVYHFGGNSLRIMGAGTQTFTSGILTGLEFSFPGSSFGGGTFQLYGFAKA